MSDKKDITKEVIKSEVASVLKTLEAKPKKINSLLEKILWVEAQAQILHWQEKSGYRHEALGSYYKDITSLIDKFVETYGGVFGTEALMISEVMYKLNNNISIKEYLDNTINVFDEFKKSVDGISCLTNIIDDIMTLINRNAYLLNKE